MTKFFQLVALFSFCIQGFSENREEPVLAYDFAKDQSINARKFLKELGFRVPTIFVSDIRPRFFNNALIMGSSDEGFLGLRARRFRDLSAEESLSINEMVVEWGVLQFPPQEDWTQRRKQRSSVGILVTFGKQTSSGAPYFIVFNLTRTGELGRYYKPPRFRSVSRLITIAHPSAGELITSQIDLEDHFNKAFGPDLEYPGVSGMVLQVDTRSMSGVGAIRSVEFLSSGR
jgi:hypothetical protein